jgi:PAS domain S-box-containing protein
MNATPAYIFVVDAEAAEGDRLQGLLASHGHRTAGFVDAAEAVESIPREPPDLILLDERVAAGAARITRLLKSDPDTCDIPIIMLSARGDRGARLESLEAGAEEFLAKPVDRDELGLRVRNLLRLKAAGDLAKGHRTELADEMLARSAELRRFRAAMDFTDDIVTLVSRATMRYTEANAAACRLLGRTRAELLALGPEHLGFDSRGTLEAIYDRIIRGELVQPQELEFVRADGSIVHLEVNRHALRADGGWSIVAVARDITERRRTEEKLRQLAHYDALTGLPNRRMFHECLARAMEQADALRQQVVLMYLDLNDFKNVNDSLGHAGGDALLREVGHRLHGALYPRDSVGRLGGDEFGIVLVTPRVRSNWTAMPWVSAPASGSPCIPPTARIRWNWRAMPIWRCTTRRAPAATSRASIPPR